MNILGIYGYFNNTSATLMVDGEIIAAAEEERFNRIKQGKENNLPINLTLLPFESIKYCLEEANLSIDDIDRVGFGFKPTNKLKATMLNTKKLLTEPKNYFIDVWDYLKPAIDQKKVGYYLTKRLGGKDFQNLEVDFIDHHTAHASSAYFVSSFNDALVVVMDGAGEKDSLTAFLGEGNKIKKVFNVGIENSLGFVYWRGTKFLGFKGFQDEYKVMGLSSLGDPTYLELLKEQVTLKKDILVLSDELKSVSGLESLLEISPRKRRANITQEHKDFASSLQKFIEWGLHHYIDLLQDTYSKKNLCLAGGVAHNCIFTEQLRSKFTEIFIQPAANDSGTSMGAALYLSNLLDKAFENKKRQHYFLGPAFTDEYIEKLLQLTGVDYLTLQEPELYPYIAEKLVGGSVVAWFQGKMEWDPRALGNRSILADPRDPTMWDKLNLAIKFREGFRPFAPSVLEDYFSEYFEGAIEGREYMQYVCPVKSEKREVIPSVVHVDGTARPQTVNYKFNPKYYNLIKAFMDLSGIPMVINTSFNVNDWQTLKGKPIVMSPTQALHDFYSSGIDYLVLGAHILSK